MANERYEGVGLDGHYTLAERIFTKIKGLFDTKVKTDVPANAVFTDTLPTAYCDSAANATTKVAQCTNFSLKNNSYIPINFINGNTVEAFTEVTLNINNTGAKPLYVNWVFEGGQRTSQPFDASTYIIYYTNNAYYLYTNGTLFPYKNTPNISDIRYYTVDSEDNSVVVVEEQGPSLLGHPESWNVDLSVPLATTVSNGLLSAADKIKIDDFEDTKVTQTESTSNENYEILVSGTASTATTTEGVNKSTGFRYNPSLKAVMEGYNTTASGLYSHVEGDTCIAIGENSHAEGYQTCASGFGSHTEGGYTTASKPYAHAEGRGSYAGGASGVHAEGYRTTALGNDSHAEGYGAYALEQHTHAEGYGTTASGSTSHSEGYNTKASGAYSHVEGFGSSAAASYAHAEGYKNIANGEAAHAEGSNTSAPGYYSHTEGYKTVALNKSQHVFGEFNILDNDPYQVMSDERGKWVEIVGNGNSVKRSNARTLDWNGNEKIAGNLTDKWGLQTSRDLFQSEFDDLTQEERDNGTTYYIKDGEPLRICDYIYPVGAIYMSVNNISPAILFGGTWERIKDRFLLAAGDDYTAGSTGGEAEHTLSIDEMPTHRHTFKSSSYGWEGYAIYGMKDTSSGSNVGLSPYNQYELSENNVVMQNTGGGQAHNNMPPYLTVYMWKRVPDPEPEEENNEEQGE